MFCQCVPYHNKPANKIVTMINSKFCDILPLNIVGTCVVLLKLLLIMKEMTNISRLGCVLLINVEVFFALL